MNMHSAASNASCSMQTPCTDACALNNMGVAMMLRGHFKDAASAFKNSLSIVRMALVNENSHGSDASMVPTPFVAEYANQKVRSASARLSEITLQRPSQSCSRVIAVESTDIDSLKAASFSRRRCGKVPSSLRLPFFAVLIREARPTYCLRGDEVNIDYESGTMLYNYGLACFLLSDSEASSKRRGDQIRSDVYYSVACRSFMASHTLFSRRLLDCNDTIEDLDAVFMNLLALSCAGDVFRARNEQTRANQADLAAETLLIAAEEERVTYLVGDGTMRAAAAA